MENKSVIYYHTNVTLEIIPVLLKTPLTPPHTSSLRGSVVTEPHHFDGSSRLLPFGLLYTGIVKKFKKQLYISKADSMDPGKENDALTMGGVGRDRESATKKIKALFFFFLPHQHLCPGDTGTVVYRDIILVKIFGYRSSQKSGSDQIRIPTLCLPAGPTSVGNYRRAC
jgi:hypothetical protein